MIRSVASALFCAALLAAGPALGEPALRPVVTVAGAVIRLGDLFTDAGKEAAAAIAPAPAPGMRATYDADWLAAVARGHGLAWAPASPYDQAIVERASRVLSVDAVAREIKDELSAREPIGDAEIRLDNPGLRFLVPADAPDSIALEALSFDARSGRFSAFVSAPAGDAAGQRQRVTGRLVYLIELPVLIRPMAPKEIIAAGDLDRIKMRRDRIGPEVATNAAQLIGKTPRRLLRSAEPVRTADVETPILVHRGELVTVVLETPMLQITSRGKALEDGAMGATIRIENSRSGRVIEASVAGPGTARVSASAAAAAVVSTAAR